MIARFLSLLTVILPTVLSEERLDNAVIPKHYEVSIFIDDLSISGTVKITIHCCNTGKDARVVTLHSKKKYGLSISGIKVEKTGFWTTTLQSGPPTYDDENDILSITLNSPLENNKKYLLSINYKGQIQDNNGYTFVYDSVGNWVTFTVGSEKQPAFPCFDEPNLRATFEISLSINAQRYTNILGYTNGARSRVGARSTDKRFYNYNAELTQEFPPSQISFVVSKEQLSDHTFAQNIEQDGYNRLLRATFIYPSARSIEYEEEIDKLVRTTKADKTEFMLNEPLEMEFLVAPVDQKLEFFKWGQALISERELIFETQPTRRMHSVFLRFSRMVFGGVISADSWDTNWFITAMAEFMALLQVPEQLDYEVSRHMWDRFSDNLDTNLENGVDGYQRREGTKIKGLQLIRMTYGYSKNFMREVTTLVQTYKYKSVSPDQFWDLFEEHLQDRNTRYKTEWKTIMRRWIDQPSYPLVTITYIGEGLFSVTQEPFLGTYDMKQGQQNSDYCWIFPLSYSVINSQSSIDFHATVKVAWDFWLKCDGVENTQLNAGVLKSDDVVVFNKDCNGMYRVRYDKESWKKIIELLAIRKDLLLPVSRGCIIHDVLALAWVGYQPYKDVFQLLTYLINENKHQVWNAFFQGATDLAEILFDTGETYMLFQDFVNSVVQEHFKAMYSDFFKRLAIIPKAPFYRVRIQRQDTDFYYWACYIARYSECTKQAIDYVDAVLTLPRSLTTMGYIEDERRMFNVLFCTFLSEEQVDATWKQKVVHFIHLLYYDNVNIAYRTDYVDVLRCINDRYFIERLLDWAASSSMNTIPTVEEKQRAFLSLAKGKNSLEPTLNYFIKNIGVKEQLQLNANTEEFISQVVLTLTPRMSSDQRNKLETALNGKNYLSKIKIKEAFKMGSEASDRRQRWLMANESEIKKELKIYYGYRH